MIEARAPTSSGYEVPLRYFPATAERDPSAHARALLLPALGVEARFYRRLSAALSARGLDVALVEQRGHGDSTLRPSRAVDFGWREMLTEDIPAGLAWLRERSPARATLLVGHSLGGHHAAITAGLHHHQQEIHGVVLAACGTPWAGAYTGSMRQMARVLRNLAGPVARLVGHYPGKLLGFGGREARTAMADWATLAKTNRYAARGMGGDLDARVATFTGAVLALRMADDPLAPTAAVEAIVDKFTAAEVTRACLDAAAIGGPADHFGWARRPEAAAERIATWSRGLARA